MYLEQMLLEHMSNNIPFMVVTTNVYATNVVRIKASGSNANRTKASSTNAIWKQKL